MKTSLATISKLMAKKYPPTNEHYLGAMLVIYDDGTGFIRGAGKQNKELHSDELFNFDSIEQLVEHLQS